MNEINKDKNNSNDPDEKSVSKKNIKKSKVEQKLGNENEKIISDLKIKLNEAEDKLLRELAENDNLRKRHEKELQDNLKFALKNFSYELLNVTDNFDRALNSIPENDIEKSESVKNLFYGLKAVEKEIHDIFEKNGVKKFDSLNEKFDPERHQAVSKKESDKDEGIIVEELQKGFMISERLLRPAMVVVSSGSDKPKDKS
ncbi:MAG: nucleotide exchange factor GrpE [Alphaproteobacteria bacterium]